MNIECHMIAWNESETIHLSIKHYQQFCLRIIIYDNYSTDNTREIALSMGCEVKLFGIEGVLDDREYTKLKNNCWKGSKADLVFIVDADEIIRILIPDIGIKDETIFRTHGWNVFHHEVPVNSWEEITTGFYDIQYSKLCVFNPKKIKEINYVHGCHIAKPEGYIKYHTQPMILFHYRNVGGPERLVQRHALYRPRMSEWNIKWKAGKHYLDEDNKRIEDWERQWRQSETFSPALISGF